MTAEEKKLKPCPFCGGQAILSKALRFGYENCQNDPDAWAYYAICRCCAAQGPWRKCETGAMREWNMRAGEKQVIGLLEEKQQIVSILEYIAQEIYSITQYRPINIVNDALDKYPIIPGRMGDDLKMREEG